MKKTEVKLRYALSFSSFCNSADICFGVGTVFVLVFDIDYLLIKVLLNFERFVEACWGVYEKII